MKHVFLFVTLFFVWSGAGLAQQSNERARRVNVIFYWVNETQTHTVETFSGGGPMYTYERLINQKMTTIDSAVFWVKGKREYFGKQQLDENSKGSFVVNEASDTLCFYARGKKAVLYIFPGAYLGTPELYFIEKPAVMLQAGLGELPYRLSNSEYALNRDYLTTQTNESWNNFVKHVSTTYKSAYSFSDNHVIRLAFFGKSQEHVRAVLFDLAKDNRVGSISVLLSDVLRLDDTYFTSPNIRIYTDKPIDTIKQVLSKHGFKTNIMVSDGSNNYDIIYTQSKMLDADFINNLKKVQRQLGVKSTSLSLYHEVRLD